MKLETCERTYGSCLAFAQARLTETDTRFICEAILDRSFAKLIANRDQLIDKSEFEQLVKAVKRRLSGEPIAYIIGSQGFWRYNFQTTPDTLIPRPETETLIEMVLPTLTPSSSVLDLGCGCGAIGLTLALETGCKATLIDSSYPALQVTERNAAALGASVAIVKSNWYDEVQGRFDCIVSNPPYVAENDDHLLEGDLRFEPMLALVGGSDGLTGLKEVIGNSPKHLNAGGRLAVEHGFDQEKDAQQLFSEAGFDEISTHTDLSGAPRVTTGVKP